VAVMSMSKQEFSRLEVLLRVQSGRLRVSDACGVRCFACCAASSRTVPRACFHAYQPDVPLLLAILRRQGSGAPRTQVDICGLGAGRHDR
jgi:hypothetical protein